MMTERSLLSELSCNSQSSNRTEFLALGSIANFLLDGAANPNPAPLFLKSVWRLCARSNSPRRPCCKVCWPSFPSAMLSWPEDPVRGWLLFLNPPSSAGTWLVCQSCRTVPCPTGRDSTNRSTQFRSKPIHIIHAAHMQCSYTLKFFIGIHGSIKNL